MAIAKRSPLTLAEQNNATAGTASLPPNTRIDRYDIRPILPVLIEAKKEYEKVK
jgi:hypothetical protein